MSCRSHSSWCLRVSSRLLSSGLQRRLRPFLLDIILTLLLWGASEQTHAHTNHFEAAPLDVRDANRRNSW